MAMERKFSSIVESISWAMRVFLDGDPQQIKILASGFGRVRMMTDEQHIRVSPNFCDTSIRDGVFVAGVVPPVAVSGVDLFVFEFDARAPVKEIPEARCLSEFPDTLDLLPPARL
jgi:hypothetical protein